MIVGLFFVVALSALIFTVILTRDDPPSPVADAGQTGVVDEEARFQDDPENDTSNHQVETETLSTLWSRQETTSDAKSDRYQSLGLSKQGIYDYIGKIPVRGNQLILDQETRSLLESAFRALGDEASLEQIEQIQTALNQKLPGELGQQASDILGRYYEYHQLRQSQVLDELQTEERIEAREAILGKKLTTQLFGQEQAYERFLQDRIAIEKNTDLTEKQKQRAIQRTQENLQSGVYFLGQTRPEELDEVNGLASPDSDMQHYLNQQALALGAARQELEDSGNELDWQQRYQSFAEQRRWILDAAMTDNDKISQMKQLMESQFTQAERSAIENYLPEQNLFN